MNEYNKNQYNYQLREERHDNIEKELETVWDRFKTLEGRLWIIILLLVFNLGGIILRFFIK